MAEAKKIPQRSEVPVEYTWNTADIYPTDEAWEAEFEEVQAAIPVLAGYAGRLGESAQTLYDYLTLCDKTVEQVNRLFQYAGLRQDEEQLRDGLRRFWIWAWPGDHPAGFPHRYPQRCCLA